MKIKVFTNSICLALLFGTMPFFMLQAQAAITNIEQLSSNGNLGNIDVQWQKPALQETEGIVLLRKENSCPTSSVDGKAVYRGNGNSFVDESGNKNTPYCYGAYIYDASGAVSALKTSGIVQRKSVVEYVQGVMAENKFIIFGLTLVAILAWLNVLKRKKIKPCHSGLDPESRS